MVNDRPPSITSSIPASVTGWSHIEITGNQYFRTEAIRERMFLQTATFLQFPHGRYSGNLLRRDEESIRNLYQSNGFRDVKVTHRVEDDYRGRTGDIAVFIHIQEGPQYFVQSLSMEGVEQLDKNAILETLSSVAGQPFSEFNVAVDRDTILAKYFENGFPKATFEWSSKPAAAAAPRGSALHASTRAASSSFAKCWSAATRLHATALINRNLRLNPGDPLSPTAITETQRRLYDLGVFAKVDAAIQNPDGETDRKYVLYNLEEARRYSLAAGFGAELGRIGGCQTCFEAPAGTTGFSPRVSFDITRNNLWGLTHSLSLRTRASTLDQRAPAELLLAALSRPGQPHPFLHRTLSELARRAHLHLPPRGRLGAVEPEAQPKPPPSSIAIPTAA